MNSCDSFSTGIREIHQEHPRKNVGFEADTVFIFGIVLTRWMGTIAIHCWIPYESADLTGYNHFWVWKKGETAPIGFPTLCTNPIRTGQLLE